MGGQTARLGAGVAGLAAFGLVAAVAVVYANALGHDFVYDDFLLIVDNPSTRMPLSEGWARLGYRPLRMLSYRIDYAIGGMDPWIFHLGNLVYHAITVLLVWAVLRTLGAAPWAAMVGALVFAVHPVQTDSVTYASGRRDVLCGLFYAAGFLAYLRHRLRGSWLALGLASVAWLLACLTKEMAATLPLVCLLAVAFLGREDAALRVRVRGVWPALAGVTGAALAVGGVLYLAHYEPFVARVMRETSWHGGSIGANFATVARVWVHYLGLLVWPARLSADYSPNAFPVSGSAADPRALAALAVLAAVAAVGVWRWRRGGLAGFGLAWVAVTLLPVSHIVPYVELLAEHYLYVPMIGVAMVVADVVGALASGAPRRRAAVVTVAMLIVAALGARSMVRNHDWRDGLTLWTATVAVVPDSARARFNLGQVYLGKGRTDDAARVWGVGAEEFPQAFPFQLALAKLAYRQGDYPSASQHAKRALRLKPGDPTVQTLAGWISLHAGNARRARALFDRALAELPIAQAGDAAVGRARAQAALDTAVLLKEHQRR